MTIIHTTTGSDATAYDAARIATPSRPWCPVVAPTVVPMTGELRPEDGAPGFAETPAWSPPT